MPDEKRRKVDIGEFDAKDREIVKWVAQVLGYDVSIFGQRIRQQIKGLTRAGVSKQKWAGMYDEPKMLKGWTMVDNLDYKKYITSKHKIADDGPVELPTNGIIHTKKSKKN